MELNIALPIVNKIVEQLRPYCDKIDIAGSCRREKPDVGDLEICAIAKMVSVKSDDLFGDPKLVVSPEFAKIANGLGKIIKGKPDGRYMQIELPEGINLDLFMPDAHDYYRQFAIRTGSSAYSFGAIATGWKKLGWVGTDGGLRKMDECEKKIGDNKWKCVNPNPELPPHWTSEKHFFDWLGVKFIEPKYRNWEMHNK
jgi:DNA polymerase/3'-5' exonuclease PolX